MQLKDILIMLVMVFGSIFFNLTILQGGYVQNKDNSCLTTEKITDESKSSLNGKIHGSVSGQVTDQETGIGIPGVDVNLWADKDIIIKTGWNGIYSYDLLEPGEYKIRFEPKHPYCFEYDSYRFHVYAGKTVIINKKLKLAGSVIGRILLKKKGIGPFENVRVSIHSGVIYKTELTEENEIITHSTRSKSVEWTDTSLDGSYFLGRLCPFEEYYIMAACNIPGQADQVLTGIRVDKGKETRVEDIVFDFNDITGIEGYVTSSLDGGYIENASVSFNTMELRKKTGKSIPVGELKTNAKGYFYMKNLEPGNYFVMAFPPVPPIKDKITGKPHYTMGEYPNLFKEKNVLIKKNEVVRIYFKLDIPSS